MGLPIRIRKRNKDRVISGYGPGNAGQRVAIKLKRDLLRRPDLRPNDHHIRPSRQHAHNFPTARDQGVVTAKLLNSQLCQVPRNRTLSHLKSQPSKVIHDVTLPMNVVLQNQGPNRGMSVGLWHIAYYAPYLKKNARPDLTARQR